MSDSRCHAHINLTEQQSACVPCLLAHVAALEQKLAAWEPVVRAAQRRRLDDDFFAALNALPFEHYPPVEEVEP